MKVVNKGQIPICLQLTKKESENLLDVLHKPNVKPEKKLQRLAKQIFKALVYIEWGKRNPGIYDRTS